MLDVLDAAVMMATLGGIATSLAAVILFVGTLRDQAGISLFVAFGFALAASAAEPKDAPDPPHDEGGQRAAEPSGGEAV
jgi:hypothetical protein